MPQTFLFAIGSSDHFSEKTARPFLGREFSAEIEHTPLVAEITHRPIHADIVGRNVDEPRLRVERDRLPVLAAHHAGQMSFPDSMPGRRRFAGSSSTARNLNIAFFGPIGRRRTSLADSSFPVRRFATKKKPLRSAFMENGVLCPPIVRSASMCSLTPS